MLRKQNDAKINIEDVDTIVGPSVSLKGTLKSDGNINLKGKISGDVKAKGDIFIDDSAEVKASIFAENVRISGVVSGDINVSGQVEITETGKVYGNIISSVLIIKMGAIFVGKSSMEVEAPLRSVKSKEDDYEQENIEPEPEIEE